MAEKEEKKEVIIITTPIGKASFPKLVTPSTKFKKLGEYNTKLILDGSLDEVKALVEMLDKAADEAFKEGLAAQKNKKGREEHRRTVAYAPEFEKDEETETGNIILTASRDAAFKKKDSEKVVEVKLDFFDAKGHKIVDPPEIFGGSMLRLSCQLNQYVNKGGKSGASLKLRGVQIISLSKGMARTAEDYGFGEEEGYEVNEEAAAEEAF